MNCRDPRSGQDQPPRESPEALVPHTSCAPSSRRISLRSSMSGTRTLISWETPTAATADARCIAVRTARRFSRSCRTGSRPGSCSSTNRNRHSRRSIRGLALLALMSTLAASGNSQFIVATHSPILLTFPEAQILAFDGGTLQQVALEDTAHFQITKGILENPAAYWRHLRAPENGRDGRPEARRVTALPPTPLLESGMARWQRALASLRCQAHQPQEDLRGDEGISCSRCGNRAG